MAIHGISRLLALTGMATACAISIETMSTTIAHAGNNDVSAAVETGSERLQWQSTVTAARADCGNAQWSSTLRHSGARDAAADGCDAVPERLDVPKGATKASHDTRLTLRSRHTPLF